MKFHWACCALNAALDVIGSQRAVHFQGKAGNNTEKGLERERECLILCSAPPSRHHYGTGVN